MSKGLQNIYSTHHHTHREGGFSILKEERGQELKRIVGEGKNVLDIGCRDGALTKYFSSDNHVLGVDIDPVALKRARESLGIEVREVDLNGDWSELGDQQFDVVVAGEVLEHLYFPDVVVEKVLKRLVPNGIFVGSVPNGFSLKNRIRLLFARKKHTSLGDPTHINHFHVEELREILDQSFSGVEIIGLGRYKTLSKMWPGLFAFDLFFLCHK